MNNTKGDPQKQAFMKKNISFPILLLTLGVFFSGNTDSTDIIYWSPEHRLTWSDFEGTPAYDRDNVSAMTSSGIVQYSGCQEGKIIYKVQAYFEKNESWVKSEALTAHHLNHEQIHFDITELYARRLRKALSDRDFKCGEEVAFETYVGNFLRNWEVEQKAYDLITQHSLDSEKQQEWYYKIAMELDLLTDFMEQ